MTELGEGRAALVVDEPEQHLHPALLSRVVDMLEAASSTAPVVVATHSDRVLDALSDPERQVVLCELDSRRAMHVRAPSPERLAEWLERYRGIGSVLAEGYQAQVFDAPGAARQ
jgi:predicted ATPase